MRVPYRKTYEQIGVTSEGAFYCLPCVSALAVAEADYGEEDCPVFLGDDHDGFTCDRCGVASVNL